jgi:hypothetical protein
MNSPAFGLGWHLWRRYHFFGIATVSYGVLLALCVPFAIRAHLQSVLLTAAGPLVIALFVSISLFANPDADIVGISSGYPSYLLTLPVRTRTLVFWPMLYGITTVVLSWLALGRLILNPLGADLPLWWPALILAALVSCIQAVFWLPLGVPYLRMGLVVLVSLSLGGLGIRGAFLLLPGLMVAVFSCVIALAYRIAVYGVARARRGDTPEWTLRSERAGGAPPAQKPFATPLTAQRWYEWRRNGILLPMIIAVNCLLLVCLVWKAQDHTPLDLLHPIVPSDEVPAGLAGIQVSVGLKFAMIYLPCITPLLAMGIGCGIWRADNRKPDHSLNPFYAVRPLSSAALVGAKFHMAACSTLLTWAIVLLFEAVLLFHSAQDGITVAPLGRLLLPYVSLKSGLLALLGLAAAILLTWKGQVGALFIDLSGRPWLANSYAMLVTGGQSGFFVLLTLINTKYPEAWPSLLKALPYEIVCAVLLKLTAGSWALNRCRQRHLIGARTMIQIGIGWLLLALGYWALLCFLLPAVPSGIGLLLCAVVLFLPLTRLALAPLAFDWNRHR